MKNSRYLEISSKDFAWSVCEDDENLMKGFCMYKVWGFGMLVDEHGNYETGISKEFQYVPT